MLVDKESKLPIFFRAIPGEVADVSTLKATFKEIKLLGLKTDEAIFDAGYFSETNIRYLCESGISFISRMPKSRLAFSALVAEQASDLENLTHAVHYGNRYVFIKSVQTLLYDHEVSAHIILDPGKRAQDIKYIMKDALENPHEKKTIQ